MKTGKKTEFFQYKGKPLVRKGNTIYYGDMNEDFVCMLTILSETKISDLSLSEKVQVQLIHTDPKTPVQDMVAKNCQRIGLYNALDIAGIWLDRSKAEEE